eukprot:5153427-Pleurochrysis_carterae.AAC.3
MRPTSLRVLAALAAWQRMMMRRRDFVAAYLQGELQSGEVVYCHAPPGYSTYSADGRRRVCRVEKPVYGMAQAGRRRQHSLFPWLRDWGFTQCKSYRCVFTVERTVGGITQRVILGCYVDDLVTLYTHDGDGSLYDTFTRDLA